jgi:drug/metabolite transporter (DMT)-like permease
VGVRFSNRELDPLWGAGLRFGLSAALLMAVMAVLRLEPPRGRALLGTVLYGLLGFGASFALAYYSLLELHAGLSQTILALVPLATLLLAVLQGQERLRRAAVVGTVLGMAGVGIMSGASLGATLPPLSLLAVLGAVFCFAQATVVVRRFPRVHPVTMNALGMAAGAGVLLAGSVAAGENHQWPREPSTWLALAYLVPIGSVLVFVLYLVALRYWDASRVAYGFVLTPVVTVILSAWLDDEPLTGTLLLGGGLILAGVYVGALRAGRHAH